MVETQVFKQLASGFYVDVDFSILDNLLEYTHDYGNEQIPPDIPCWMTYGRPRDNSWELPHGYISSTRLTRQLLPDFTLAVVTQLSNIFGNSIKWNEDRVHIIRTSGFILPHIDEARSCSINIGLKNTSSAETKFGKHGRKIDFKTNDVDTYICQDGGVYALDVTKCHAVYPIIDVPRYLITYGFGITYDRLLSTLQP